MPQRSFLRRFRLLLAVLILCVAATAYWGFYRYFKAGTQPETKIKNVWSWFFPLEQSGQR